MIKTYFQRLGAFFLIFCMDFFHVAQGDNSGVAVAFVIT